jgi:hypothetical protein
MVLALAAALSGTACGEITAFCMTAGAPSGVRLVVTTTPTGVQCSYEGIEDYPGRPVPKPPGSAAP